MKYDEYYISEFEKKYMTVIRKKNIGVLKAFTLIDNKNNYNIIDILLKRNIKQSIEIASILSKSSKYIEITPTKEDTEIAQDYIDLITLGPLFYKAKIAVRDE